MTARRLAAYGIDVTLLAVVLLPLAAGMSLALGTEDVSGPVAWGRSLLLVSIPAWGYFVAADLGPSGRTLGKRLLGLRTRLDSGSRPRWRVALVRTALKLLPWELIHVAFFTLAEVPGRVSPPQLTAAGAAYLLMAVYVIVAVRQGGERSVPDLLAGSRVVRTG